MKRQTLVYSVNPKYLEQLITIIKTHLPKITIYLYGSRARGNNYQGSDIDLALDAQIKIPFKTICTIQNDIDESSIPHFVDITDIHNVDPDFLKEIQEYWIKLTP